MNMMQKKKKLFTISIFPIMIMLIGPPGFRPHDLEFHASQGSVDIRIVNTLCYMLIFLFCLIVILRDKNYLSFSGKRGLSYFNLIYSFNST